MKGLRYRWLKYFKEGVWSVQGMKGLDGGLAGGGSAGASDDALSEGMEFWTRFGSYRELVDYPKMAGLEGSDLVIFKVCASYWCI